MLDLTWAEALLLLALLGAASWLIRRAIARHSRTDAGRWEPASIARIDTPEEPGDDWATTVIDRARGSRRRDGG
jgi:hypothetical protein